MVKNGANDDTWKVAIVHPKPVNGQFVGLPIKSTVNASTKAQLQHRLLHTTKEQGRILHNHAVVPDDYDASAMVEETPCPACILMGMKENRGQSRPPKS